MIEEKLDGGLVVRTLRSAEDVRRCAEFNARCNNPSEGATYECLHMHFPGMRWDESLLIADESDGKIAATICLIPWEMDFGGVRLKTAQLEMVLSHPEYRKRGLVARLINRFMENLPSAGYDVSIIWGIPYYYRKYGYSYCHYGNGYVTLPVARIPDYREPPGDALSADNPARYALRRAAETDISALAELYGASARRYQLHIARDGAIWRYLIRDASHPVWLVEDTARGNRPVSYLIYDQSGASAARIAECGADSHADALTVLRLLKANCNGVIHVGGPAGSVAVKLARSLGSVASQPEQWLMRVTDIPAFFMKIAPVLEKRLADSDCAGVSTDVVINLYRKAYRLTFSGGRLAAAEDIGFRDYSMGADGGDLCVPPDAFTRLVFGFRPLERLLDAWPDIVINPSKRYLIDALFPETPAFIHTPFHYVAKT